MAVAGVVIASTVHTWLTTRVLHNLSHPLISYHKESPMPLDKGANEKAMASNIKELEATGKYPKSQSIAIAEDVARKGVGVKAEPTKSKIGVKKEPAQRSGQ